MNKTNFQKIVEFHEAFGMPHSTTLNLSNLQNFKIASLRVKLIDEEFNELLSAPNLVEQLDAIGDLLYVIYGAGSSFGFDMDTEYSEYCNHLMTINMVTDEEQYCPPTTTNFYKTFYLNLALGINNNINPSLIDVNKNDNFKMLIQELSYNLMMCYSQNVKKNLLDMLYAIYSTGFFCDFLLDDLFTEIHNSNMTKLCNTEQEAIESVEFYRQTQLDRYPEPAYKKSPDNIHLVIYEKTTGKTLKSKYFSLPNIIPENLNLQIKFC